MFLRPLKMATSMISNSAKGQYFWCTYLFALFDQRFSIELINIGVNLGENSPLTREYYSSLGGWGVFSGKILPFLQGCNYACHVRRSFSWINLYILKMKKKLVKPMWTEIAKTKAISMQYQSFFWICFTPIHSSFVK